MLSGFDEIGLQIKILWVLEAFSNTFVNLPVDFNTKYMKSIAK